MNDLDLPNVSINLPIYNRSKWLSLITFNLKLMDYPKEKLELVILDDSDTDPLFGEVPIDMFKKVLHPMKINYIKDKTRREIGDKRNILCKKSTHNIIACMDSDDIYLPTYIRYYVNELKRNRLGAVGSNEMIFTFPYLNFKLTGIKCESNRQIHEATLVYTKKHFRAMGGFDKSSQGEGAKMFDFMNSNRVKQLPIVKCMVCVVHNDNTCDKKMFEDKQPIDGYLDERVELIINDILNIPKLTPESKENILSSEV